jgi:hypothetical protein
MGNEAGNEAFPRHGLNAAGSYQMCSLNKEEGKSAGHCSRVRKEDEIWDWSFRKIRPNPASSNSLWDTKKKTVVPQTAFHRAQETPGSSDLF